MEVSKAGWIAKALLPLKWAQHRFAVRQDQTSPSCVSHMRNCSHLRGLIAAGAGHAPAGAHNNAVLWSLNICRSCLLQVLAVPLPEHSSKGQRAASTASYGCSVDVWAVGILTFELLTGKPPFEVEDPDETVRYASAAANCPHCLAGATEKQAELQCVLLPCPASLGRTSQMECTAASCLS